MGCVLLKDHRPVCIGDAFAGKDPRATPNFNFFHSRQTLGGPWSVGAGPTALSPSQASGVVTPRPRMSTPKCRLLWPGSGTWFGEVPPLALWDALWGMFESQPPTGAEMDGNLRPLARIWNIPRLGWRRRSTWHPYKMKSCTEGYQDTGLMAPCVPVSLRGPQPCTHPLGQDLPQPRSPTPTPQVPIPGGSRPLYLLCPLMDCRLTPLTHRQGPICTVRTKR